MCRLIEHATRLIGEGHTMIDTNWETTARVALAFLLSLLEDAAKLNEICTTAEVAGFGEVAIREDVARTKVNEMGAISELLSECDRVIMLASGERTCTIGQAVMLVRNGVEEPLDILHVAYDTWQTEDWIRRIVRVYTHIDVVLLADWHDGVEPVLHVLLKLLLVDTIVKLEQVAELLDRSSIALAEVS